MELVNTTVFPDYFLRRLVSFCCRELELPVKKVRKAVFRRRSDTTRSGHCYPSFRRVVMSLGHLVARPVKDGERWNYDDGKGNRFKYEPARDVADLLASPVRPDAMEQLVHVTAHELAHLEQSLRGEKTSRFDKPNSGRRLLMNGGSEKNTNALAAMVEKAFADRREQLMAEWMAEPPAKAKATVVEKRAAKAAKQLATWERRLKTAQRKVKEYRRKVAYYERKNSV